MLSRRTLGVAGAAILGSMALLVTNPANAVLNLTPGTGETAGKVKIARETLLTGTANTTTVGGVTYHDVTNASNLLDIQFNRGIVAGTAEVYYRVTLENMVFAAPATPAAGGGGTVAAVAGGADGDNYVVFSVAGAGGGATEDVTVAAVTLGVLPDTPGNIKVEVYRDAFDAQAGTNAVGSLTKTMSEAVMAVDGISERGTPGMPVAEVSENFTQLAGGADSVQIGRLRITADTAAFIKAGTAVATLASMLDSTATPVIEVTFKGDFSVGEYSLDPDADCDGLAADGTTANDIASTVDDDGKAMLTPDTQPDGTTNIDWYLCLMVAEDNDMALPTGDFTATVEYAALENSLGRADQTVTIGSIGRNGTTVHIPFITVNERHHQRLVIMNRGPEARYSLRFMMEEGRTATPGALASGMLPANRVTTLSIRNDDVVMVEGGTRTAATLTVVGDPDDIGVSTVIHSPSTGNTDTVLIQE